jgi:hypothetical protein
MVSSWDLMFLRRRRRRQLRLSKCSHVVVPRPSQPAIGEVPTGDGGLVYNDGVACVTSAKERGSRRSAQRAQRVRAGG